MGRKSKKQVDVIGEIIKCIEELAVEDEIISGEEETSADELEEYVYKTNKSTNSQLKSIYRAVNNLEKKGMLYSKKIKSPALYGCVYKWGGCRYEKKIYAIIKNGKVIKKC